MCHGRLHRGSSGAGGVIGHMTIHPLGPRCGCGSHGCLEAYIGTEAILRMGRAAIRKGAEPLRTLARQGDGSLTPKLIHQAAQAGDLAAQHIWERLGYYLGVGIASTINLLNPDRIVIGGGVAGAWASFAPTLRKTVRALAMPVSVRAARIVPARLGNRAGIVGAAVLVWNEFESR